MRICLANLHFLFNFELRSKILMLEKNSKKIWFFTRLFVSLQPITQIINKIMDDYPADNYNS